MAQILIVEDNAADMKLACLLLRKAGLSFDKSEAVSNPFIKLSEHFKS